MKPLIDGPIARDPRMGRIEIRRRSRAIDDPWGDPNERLQGTCSPLPMQMPIFGRERKAPKWS
jgi:hypothetical protein